MKENNPTIVSDEMFKAVQKERNKRIDITKNEDGTQRKNKKYSSKK